MKIALVQADLIWENPKKNKEHLNELIKDVNADIFIFPEMFTTGFTMNTDNVAEKMEGETVLWIKQIAKNKNAVIAGSLIIEENGKYYNRMIWVQPDGKEVTYDKRHLFRMANEHAYFSPGNYRLIIEYKGIRFCPLICYDLRFPVWSRNIDSDTLTPAYDCLFYVANWPEVRRDAWKSLLKARAIENQCYVFGVNRVGTDGKGISYSGDSRAYSPKGERMDAFKERTEKVEVVEIDMNLLSDFREKFPVSMDADKYHL